MSPHFFECLHEQGLTLIATYSVLLLDPPHLGYPWMPKHVFGRIPLGHIFVQHAQHQVLPYSPTDDE